MHHKLSLGTHDTDVVRAGMESKSEWDSEAMRRDPAEEPDEECGGWFHVVLMATSSTSANAMVVEGEKRGDGILRCELAMCRKGSDLGHPTHVLV